MLVILAKAGIQVVVPKLKMDYPPLLRRALRAIGFADVRFGIVPSQSGLRRNDEKDAVDQAFLGRRT
ncbi:MAG TPA: hypothetical protein VF292_09655 [Rhodanobacteraceae bacterium]